MKRDDTKNVYTGTKIPDRYLIHSLNGNTSGNNTADSIMNIITQRPSSSTNQPSQHSEDGE